MEFRVGATYTYGRFDQQVKLLSMIAHYQAVEVKFSNGKTAWINRDELSEIVTQERIVYNANAGKQSDIDNHYFWHGMPQSFALTEELRIPDGAVMTQYGEDLVGIRKGAKMYVRATHDNHDRMLIAPSASEKPDFLIEVDGPWLRNQLVSREEIEAAEKIADALEDKIEEAEADEEKKSRRRKIRAIFVRILDGFYHLAPVLMFTVATILSIRGNTEGMLWAFGAMFYFMLIRVHDMLYMISYKMGPARNAQDSE